MRPADAAPLGAIRSLACFLPVIEQVRELRVSQDYFLYLRHKLQRMAPNPVGAHPVRTSARMMHNQTARLRRG
jgi:hypothetical protein